MDLHGVADEVVRVSDAPRNLVFQWLISGTQSGSSPRSSRSTLNHVAEPGQRPKRPVSYVTILLVIAGIGVTALAVPWLAQNVIYDDCSAIPWLGRPASECTFETTTTNVEDRGAIPVWASIESDDIRLNGGPLVGGKVRLIRDGEVVREATLDVYGNAYIHPDGPGSYTIEVRRRVDFQCDWYGEERDVRAPRTFFVDIRAQLVCE